MTSRSHHGGGGMELELDGDNIGEIGDKTT